MDSAGKAGSSSTMALMAYASKLAVQHPGPQSGSEWTYVIYYCSHKFPCSCAIVWCSLCL